MSHRIFVAFDQTQWSAVETLGRQLQGSGAGAKVGLELYSAHGPRSVEFLASLGLPVFLDLKLHDIPNTVQRALRSFLRLPIDLVNVHAAGGQAMLEAAAEALVLERSAARLIAVTQLTSTSEAEMQRDQGITSSLQESVLRYARLAHRAGLAGVVCSAQEARLVKDATATSFLCVTPGIRLAAGPSHDQKRIMTPAAAIANGADYLVVGRAITEARDPHASLLALLKELPA